MRTIQLTLLTPATKPSTTFFTKCLFYTCSFLDACTNNKYLGSFIENFLNSLHKIRLINKSYFGWSFSRSFSIIFQPIRLTQLSTTSSRKMQGSINRLTYIMRVPTPEQPQSFFLTECSSKTFSYWTLLPHRVPTQRIQMVQVMVYQVSDPRYF